MRRVAVSLVAQAPFRAGHDTERFQLAVQCAALHADEFRRAADIAAKAVDLGQQVFARVAQSGSARRSKPFTSGGTETGSRIVATSRSG